ncbi:energy transducer TonB [Granulicella sp. L60]|uniref:energy transducer TonB n=1 Tax=Granulicella sp. L60 TaxID=1641866 RepID=UPI00131C043B|nr:energy transducer TonB [Granulicella sp. L60]
MRAAIRIVVLTLAATLGACTAHAQSDSASDSSGPPSNLPAAGAGTKDHPMRVSSGVMAALLQHRVEPTYPPNANGISGAISLVAVIDPDGNVSQLTALSGPDLLREPALAAVRQWTYKPYQLNGKARYVQTIVIVSFTPPK